MFRAYAYSAYGSPVFMNGTGIVQSASAIGIETLYAGYRWDGTTPQMYYVRNRFLLPMIGTWNRRDPLGYVDGMELYQYVLSSPVRSLDSTGLSCLFCDEDAVVEKEKFEPRTIPGARPHNGGGDCWDIDLPDFLEWYQVKYGPVKDDRFRPLQRGCVGIAVIGQKCPRNANPSAIMWPESLLGTKCFLTQAEADAYNCPNGKTPFVFARQGTFKNGKPPIPGKGGVIEDPHEAVLGTELRNEFNYISKLGGYYWWMNHGSQIPGTLVITICDVPAADDHYPDEIWCVTCKKCNPSMKDPGGPLFQPTMFEPGLTQ
ncbi:MAG: hypothetical protein NTX48_06840 [Planctomycetales bacterium]|nr:hypothetical protein [Planctomycetales bacterium]